MQGLLTSRWSSHRTPSLNQRYFQIPANRRTNTAVAVQTRLWMSGKQRPLPRPIRPAPAPLPQTINSDDGGCENTKMLCMREEGLINRKELHGTVSISALSGNWAHQKAGVTLQGYKLSFTCNQIDEKFSNFILSMMQYLIKMLPVLMSIFSWLRKWSKPLFPHVGQVI